MFASPNMLTTHNFRIYKPNAMQTPLCQSLKVIAPKYAICSNSIHISKFVWVDGHYPEKSQLELDLAEDANETYSKLGTLPKHMEFETIFIDPCIRNVYLNKDSQLTLSVAPCMGVMNEFNERVNKLLAHKKHSDLLKKIVEQSIETDPERFYLHGEFVEKTHGSIKLLKYPVETISLNSNISTKTGDKARLVVNFEISTTDLEISGISTAIPTIPFFGAIINSEIQPKLATPRHIEFAVGLTQWIPHQYDLNDSFDELIGCGSFKGLLVIDVGCESEANEISEIFTKLSSIEPAIRNIHCNFTADIPAAHWICFADSEVLDYLNNNPKKDALDAMLSIAQLERYSIITIGGYALLSNPRTYPEMPNIKGEHAWSESIFKLTYLESDSFNPSYLLRLNCDNEGLFCWEHCP